MAVVEGGLPGAGAGDASDFATAGFAGAEANGFVFGLDENKKRVGKILLL